MSVLICSIATCPAACGRPRPADLRQHPSRNTRRGRSMSMHATMSLADGVVDPVIASRESSRSAGRRVTAIRALKSAAPLEDGDTRCTNHVLTGGPRAYTNDDGIIVIIAHCL